MQSILPDNFPIENLPPAERYKVEAFYDQFVVKKNQEYGMGHFLLACYAAMPVVITPDLLYKLWLNFTNYYYGQEQQINHVAVADLLLSPLVQETGYETFEMPVEVKNAFLTYWKSELEDGNYFQMPALETIAKFLLGYSRVFRTNDPRADEAFRQAQEITAWSYLDTNRASAMLMNMLEQANQKARLEPDNRQAQAEQLRLLEVIRRTDQRQDLGLIAAGQAMPEGFRELASVSGQLQNLLTGREAELVQLLEKQQTPLVLHDRPGNGFSIKAPGELVKKLEYRGETKPASKLFLLLVGIDRYAGRDLDPLQGCKANVENLAATIEQLDFEVGYKIELTDQEATRTDIPRAMTFLLEKASPADQVLFYFSGHTMNLEGRCNLVAYDSRKEDNYRGVILEEWMQIMAKEFRELPNLTLLLDTDFQDINIPSEKMAVLSTGGADVEGESRFLKDFLSIFRQSRGKISLQKLMAATAWRISGSLGEIAYRSPGSDRMPKLFARPGIARLPFLFTGTEVREIQYLLRSLGYYDGSTNDVYNRATDEALQAFLSEKNVTGTLSPDAILDHLRKERTAQDRTGPMYFLFAFSNPNGKLPMLNDEMEQLRSLSDQMERMTGAEVIFLENPTAEVVRHYFTDSVFRNRIALFHFAGFEADPEGSGEPLGMFFQRNDKKELVRYEELHRWLDYQENIRLFYLNTCWSAVLAKALAIRGVHAVIGAPGLVSDTYAYEFSSQFYRNLAEGLPLREAFEKISLYTGYGGPHRAASYESPAQEMVEFNLFYNWGRKEEAAKWSWRKEETSEQEPVEESLEDRLRHVRTLIENDELEMAFEALEKLDEDFNAGIENDIVLQKSRFSSNKKDMERGILPNDHYTRTLSQTRYALLSMLDAIPRKVELNQMRGQSNISKRPMPKKK